MAITVTLSNPHQLAAADAAYKATIPTQPDPPAEPVPAPYASVGAYVQAAIERVAESWAESTKVDQISVGDFILRFGAAEYGAITSINDSNVKAILATLRARDNVRLGSADAVNGIAYLVSIGLLSASRGAEVLRYP